MWPCVQPGPSLGLWVPWASSQVRVAGPGLTLLQFGGGAALSLAPLASRGPPRWSPRPLLLCPWAEWTHAGVLGPGRLGYCQGIPFLSTDWPAWHPRHYLGPRGAPMTSAAPAAEPAQLPTAIMSWTTCPLGSPPCLSQRPHLHSSLPGRLVPAPDSGHADLLCDIREAAGLSEPGSVSYTEQLGRPSASPWW